MNRRVQFDHYGPPDVLRVVDVPRPSAGGGQVVVRVVAAGINPGEIAIRNGVMKQMFPATFPSGQGSDFAGRVVETGPGVTGSRQVMRSLAGPTAGRRRPIMSCPTPGT
jgi:NADPH:quinone reductase-like Zn-dependent oxidoreductase